MGLPVLGVVAYAQSFADGVHTSIPAPGAGCAGSGPRRSELPAGPIAGHSCVRRRHRGDLQARHLDAGQRSERDRVARAASPPTAWPLSGRPAVRHLAEEPHRARQGRRGGVPDSRPVPGAARRPVPPNRSLDCVDDELAVSAHFVWPRQTLHLGDRVPLKAGLVTSLGFGHVSGLVAVVHPQAFPGVVESGGSRGLCGAGRRPGARGPAAVGLGDGRRPSALRERSADRRFDHDFPEKPQEAAMLLTRRRDSATTTSTASRVAPWQSSVWDRPCLASRFAEQVDRPGTVFAETFTPGERRHAADKSSMPPGTWPPGGPPRKP